MKEFKLIKIVYMVAIAIFSVCIGLFMSTLIQSEEYIPTHRLCDNLEFSTLACILDDTTYFNFRPGFESSPFVLRMNNQYVGELSEGRAVDFETSNTQTYQIVPEVSAGYKCVDKIQTISSNQIPQC